MSNSVEEKKEEKGACSTTATACSSEAKAEKEKLDSAKGQCSTTKAAEEKKSGCCGKI